MKKMLLSLTMILIMAGVLVGCGGNDPLQIWVGSESQDFYQEKMNEYVENYNASHEEAFPFEVQVKGVDTGTAAATYLDDMQAGADIFTVAHDNLGKLTAGSSSIAPITNEALLAQIEALNPESFKQVIRSTVDGTEYTFGVPYIAQALVLYYNTKYISEEQVETWEGIVDAATAAEDATGDNKQALSLAGVDGYNNSFLILARNAETGESSLELYEDGVQENCYFTGDDMISVMQWGQWFFTHPNGARRTTDSGWEIELKNEISISFIGGAWHFSAAEAALGDNLGITVLPKFTITEEQAYSSIEAGTEFRSGTFADAKIFVMKKNSEKAGYLQDILLYLSSKDMQEESFEEVANLPAYKNAAEEFDAFQEDTLEADLASAQVRMFEYGIPQPFGVSQRYNLYYYSKGAPDLIIDVLENVDDEYSTTEAIIAEMENIEHIWKTGNKLSDEE